MGREAREGGKETRRTSSSRGAGGCERDQNLRETIQRCSPPIPRPSRNIVILGIFVVPAKKKGSNVRWKPPNLSFKQGAPAIERARDGGEFAFLFAALKLYPLRERRGMNRLLRRLKRNVVKRTEREKKRKEKKRKEEGEKGNNFAQLIP